MAVKFLSEDWAAQATQALQAHEQFKASADMSLQFVVSDAPEGEVKFYMDASGDEPVQTVGELENAEELGSQILKVWVEVGGVLTGAHGVGD